MIATEMPIYALYEQSNIFDWVDFAIVQRLLKEWEGKNESDF